MNNSEGFLIWITGPSGAGKTTFAGVLNSHLKKNKVSNIHLDGDKVREVFGNDLGHTHEERLLNAYRICRLAKLLVDQGFIVTCSTMSLFPEIWSWNRKNFKNYLEVLIRAPLSVLKERNSKGIYSKISQPENTIVGVDLPLNEPPHPDIVIENSFKDDAVWNDAKDQILIKINNFIANK